MERNGGENRQPGFARSDSAQKRTDGDNCTKLSLPDQLSMRTAAPARMHLRNVDCVFFRFSFFDGSSSDALSRGNACGPSFLLPARLRRLVFAGLSSPACLRRPVFVSCFPFLSGDRFSTVFRVPELSRDDLQRVSEQLPSVRAERGMWITAECEISRSQKTDGQSAKRRLRKKQLRSKKTGRDKGAQ